jgi:hypothetical protein
MITAGRIADAFEATGLGDVGFPAPITRDGGTTHVVIDLYPRVASDAMRARTTLAYHLGISEDRLSIRATHPDRPTWAELTLHDLGTEAGR